MINLRQESWSENLTQGQTIRLDEIVVKVLLKRVLIEMVAQLGNGCTQ